MSVYTKQPSSKDTRLDGGNATVNYGGDNDVQLNDQAADIQRGIFYFDISDFGYFPTSATLKLYYLNKSGTDPNGITIWAYKLIRNDWVELESTWTIYKTSNNWTAGGGDYVTSSPAGGSTTFPAGFGWMTWNITDIVKDAIDNESGHLNILVKFATETEAGGYHYAYFYSREGTPGDTTKRPKVEITYTDVPISVSDTLSLSESAKENLTSKSSDTLTLSESLRGTDMGFTKTDTLTITDKLLQTWRRLAKHISTWIHLTKNR